MLSPVRFGVSYTSSSGTRCFQLAMNTYCHGCHTLFNISSHLTHTYQQFVTLFQHSILMCLLFISLSCSKSIWSFSKNTTATHHSLYCVVCSMVEFILNDYLIYSKTLSLVCRLLYSVFEYFK